MRHTSTNYDTLHCFSNITDDEVSCYREVHLNTMMHCIVVQVLHLMVKWVVIERSISKMYDTLHCGSSITPDDEAGCY